MIQPGEYVLPNGQRTEVERGVTLWPKRVAKGRVLLKVGLSDWYAERHCLPEREAVELLQGVPVPLFLQRMKVTFMGMQSGEIALNVEAN